MFLHCKGKKNVYTCPAFLVSICECQELKKVLIPPHLSVPLEKKTDTMKTNYRIAPFTYEYLDDCTQLLTDAFADNSAYQLIFREGADPRPGLYKIFKSSLRLLNDKQALSRIILDRENGDLLGTYTLIPPQHKGAKIGTYLSLPFPQFVWEYGIFAVWRMFETDRLNIKALQKAMPQDEFAYLSMVAIVEEKRGTGIGSYAMQACIEEHERGKDAALPIALTTQLPENVRFYEKHGFQLLDEGLLRLGRRSYYNYCMSRPSSRSFF